MARRPRALTNAEIDRFFVALTTLLRNYQFRDRDRTTICGISINQCYALDIIAREGRLTISDIGDRLALNKSNASRIVDSLEAAGLVARSKDAINHRLRWIAPTREGRRRHARIRRQLNGDYRRILGPFSRDFIEKVTALLHAIALRARQSAKTRCQ